jgi:hypothetical protein
MSPIVSENIYQTLFNFTTCLTPISSVARIVVVFDYVRWVDLV